MQAENSRSASGRWTTRDILTFVVFNLVIVFLTMAAKMIEDMLLAPQNTFFVGSWLFPLISTPFYVVMADRIGKRGVLAASILVFGVLYTFMGGLYCAPVAVVGAVVGELVMWGKGSYHDIKRIVGGYIVYWVTFGFYGIMPYLLFREATASIDPENESLIQEALSELTRGKTVVVIAHRLATIEHADQILVVEGGRIVQRGTHEELLGQEGTYRRFVEIRSRAEGWRIGGAPAGDLHEELTDASCMPSCASRSGRSPVARAAPSGR